MADAQKAPGDAPPPKRKKLFLIVGLLMAVEGAGIFFLVRMFDGVPQAAAAQDGSAGTAGQHHAPATSVDDVANKGKLEELKIADCRPSNKINGRLITFQVSVSVLVSTEHAEKAKELITMHDARLRDRVNFVFRSAEPEHINEAGLETVKRRLKMEFERVLEDSQIVKEVLIPEFLQSGSGL